MLIVGFLIVGALAIFERATRRPDTPDPSKPHFRVRHETDIAGVDFRRKRGKK